MREDARKAALLALVWELEVNQEVLDRQGKGTFPVALLLRARERQLAERRPCESPSDHRVIRVLHGEYFGWSYPWAAPDRVGSY
jgi:hypothetical protein